MRMWRLRIRSPNRRKSSAEGLRGSSDPGGPGRPVDRSTYEQQRVAAWRGRRPAAFESEQ